MSVYARALMNNNYVYFSMCCFVHILRIFHLFFLLIIFIVHHISFAYILMGCVCVWFLFHSYEKCKEGSVAGALTVVHSGWRCRYLVGQ